MGETGAPPMLVAQIRARALAQAIEHAAEELARVQAAGDEMRRALLGAEVALAEVQRLMALALLPLPPADAPRTPTRKAESGD